MMKIERKVSVKYRKLPFIRGFGWAYKRRGLYLDGLISGRKKRFEMSNSTIDRRMI